MPVNVSSTGKIHGAMTRVAIVSPRSEHARDASPRATGQVRDRPQHIAPSTGLLEQPYLVPAIGLCFKAGTCTKEHERSKTRPKSDPRTLTASGSQGERIRSLPEKLPMRLRASGAEDPPRRARRSGRDAHRGRSRPGPSL